MEWVAHIMTQDLSASRAPIGVAWNNAVPHCSDAGHRTAMRGDCRGLDSIASSGNRSRNLIIWGTFWGLVLALAWPGHFSEAQVAGGAMAGAVAGWSLRTALRAELTRQSALWNAAPAAPADPLPTEIPAAASAPHDTGLDSTAAAQPKAVTLETPTVPPYAALVWAKLRDWLLGGNTIVRMGVLVLFVGLAFLAKYAVEHSMVPPELRLAGIALTGIGLFAGGFWMRGARPARLAYALTLQGAGVAVLYLTVFSAFRIYQFLPASTAFVLLGLICAFASVIALAQNAMVMAVIGFAGGFAAPILLSTGDGSHVALFSYYLLLNIAIAAIAYLKAWRALNLLGFFATFGVATAWGVLKYQPDQFASAQPFLLAFFLIYVAASLMYATRHSLGARQAVDATLIFGTPLIAFGLQVGLVRHIEFAAAFSALALGAFYLALAWLMGVRWRQGDTPEPGAAEVRRWLGECFVALGIGFVTLAVPLALDARWTSAVWAAEGAGVYWMGMRQHRWLPRLAGLALQGLAAIAFLNSFGFGPDPQWPVANPVFVGAMLLGGSAFAVGNWSRAVAAQPGGALAKAFARIELALSPVLFWIGFLWCQFALGTEITRAPIGSQGTAEAVFGPALQVHLQLLAWLVGAFVAHRLALPGALRPWPVAATPALFNLPAMLAAATYGMLAWSHVLQSWGWLVWPIALALHMLMLRRLDDGQPAAWWPWVHAGGVWLLVLILGNVLVFAAGHWDLWQTAWASVILLLAGTLVLLLLSRRAWFDQAAGGYAAWPLDRFARAYLWLACAPLAALVMLGSLTVALHSDGNARPLPYLPLINPTDLSVALGLAACSLWWLRIRASGLFIPSPVRDTRLWMVLAAVGFVAINTAWLRVAHHYAGVPWNTRQLYDSFLVQAGYSIVWTSLALLIMVIAHRRLVRPLWSAGALLLAVTVAKLFLIDLSNRGGTERIVVFIAVGGLMLLVGYFAPIPPAARDTAAHTDSAKDPEPT